MNSSTSDRRAAARRRAWGRGPAHLRFDSLEGRELMTANVATLPDLVNTNFSAGGNYDWDQLVHVQGIITNRGGGTTSTGTTADIYVSSTPSITGNSVKIGTVQIPSGLGVGQTIPYDQQLRLPATSIPGIGADGLVYVEVQIDPKNLVSEQNKVNNVGQGQGYDTSVIYIVPQRSSALRTSSFALSTSNAAWGSTINVTAQVTNGSSGDAAATRGRVVLTPSGIAPGTGSDYTIGDVNVPAVTGYNAVNVVQQLTLPSTIPHVLAGYTNYTVSFVLDSDYVANPMFPHVTARGVGVDLAGLSLSGGTPSPTITTTPTASTATTTTNPDGTTTTTTNTAATPVTSLNLPDLASAGIQVPASLTWGQTFQVSTSIQNLGIAAAGPFDVRFVMIGVNGDLSFGVNLGDVQVASLASNTGQNIVATVRLPGRVPAGVTLSAGGQGRIVAIVDPENRVDEQLHTNNTSTSSPINLSIPGRSATSSVPTETGVSYAALAAAQTKKGAKTTVGKPTPAGNLAPKATPGKGNGNAKTGLARTVAKQPNTITKVGNKITRGFKSIFHIK